jgi:hypothetical protein
MIKQPLLFFTFLATTLVQLTLSGQDLPKFINLSDDLTQITTGAEEIKGFYNESKLRQIYLEFQETDFWTQLENNYDTENYVEATLLYKDDTLQQVGVQFKGNTSYTQLPDGTEKMSFSIKTDQFLDGQDIDGYSTLNLNNAYQDATMMREVLYAHLCRNHIPAPQANFIELFINGEYWGVYANVQQVNKDMLEEWFMSNDGPRFRATSDSSTNTGGGGPGGGGPGGGGPGGGGPGSQWGDGTAALNYHDADTNTYKDYYTLKSSDMDGEWELLIELCDILNNTPIEDLDSTLKNYLDIDRTLWYLAHEILYSDDDSYVYKGKMDYYVYYEVETGRWTPLEFDGNSAMDSRNVEWEVFMNEDNPNYPLMNRLFAIPDLRQRYLAHVRTIVEEEMDLDSVYALIDTYAALIDSSISADPKKLMTYQEYTDGITELKTYFSDRVSFINSNTEVAVSPLNITDVSFSASETEFALPYSNEPVHITATIDAGTSGSGVSSVMLYYSTGFVGNYESLIMYDDGNHMDGEAGDGVYGISYSDYEAGDYIRFYIAAYADDETNTVVYHPSGAEHNAHVIRVKYDENTTSDLVINELQASNDTTKYDELYEYDDWIELYNNSDQSISLTGYYLSDNVDNLMKFELPNLDIEPDSYVLVWADEDGEQGDLHANFKLNKDGEELFLVNYLGEIVDQVNFGYLETDLAYARNPNGTGNFVEQLPTVLANNEGNLTAISAGTDEEILLYPNPVQGELHIEGSSSNLEVIVFDAVGRIQHTESASGAILSIDTNQWETGVYQVKVNQSVFKVMVD